MSLISLDGAAAFVALLSFEKGSRVCDPSADVPVHANDAVCIRMATPFDIGRLADHFANLSPASRNKRFMGATTDFIGAASDCLSQPCDADRFALLAEVKHDGRSLVIGEARYVFDRTSGYGEFALSVADGFQRRGIGLALLVAIETRAAGLGHALISAETTRTNAEMGGLAKKAGYVDAEFVDWQSVRFVKGLPRTDGPK
ncbi:GNAT superfamily N-acetyltransferase [Bradyrhizobium sp. BR13661]|jgi:GNAT superfamily N-acetyltransferase|nr:GNAT superfamily N-acetyltransferase [Bradyrhizobium sp. BR13661]